MLGLNRGLALFGVFFLLFCAQAGASMNGPFEEKYYDVYYEDVESNEYGLDGYPDILLRSVPRIIPLGVRITFPIAVNSGFETLLFCGTSSGEFVACTISPNAEMPAEPTDDFELMVGDFDGDGEIDILLHSKDASDNTVYLKNNGNGGFDIEDQFTHIGDHAVSGNTNVTATDNIGAEGAEIVIDDEFYSEAQGGDFNEPRRINLLYSLVGASQSSFSVSKGQAQLSIPIQVASGGAGVAPSVSLNYSSNGDYGQAGMGFQISGLSKVKRCGRNNLQDGYVQAADGSDQDLACLDGGRLILVSGTYWQSGSEYRLEQEDSSRVVFENGGFTQYKKDGDIYRYGQTDNSRVAGLRNNEAIATWALGSVSDRLGYGYRIEYLPDRAATFPDFIEYTVKAGSSEPGHAVVDFSYEADPYGQSIPVLGRRYDAGIRLSSIQSRVGGSTLREYHFSYDTNPVTRRSLISSYAECDYKKECFQATELEWQNAGPVNFSNGQYIKLPAGPEEIFQEGLPRSGFNRWADINRDKIDDYCRISTYSGASSGLEIICYVNDGNGNFGNPILIDAGLQGTEPVPQSSGIYLVNWNVDPAWRDINNDGYTDFCYSVPLDEKAGWAFYGTDRIKCHLNDGQQVPSFDTVVSFDIDRPAAVGDVAGRSWTDFDGDGNLDYCFSYKPVNGNKYVTCALKKEGVFEFEDHVFTQRIERTGGYWVDVSGDSLPDFCRTKKDRIVCDINKNGKDLTAGRWSKSGSHLASRSEPSFPYQGSTTKYFSARFFDFSGNGYSDYCRIYMDHSGGYDGYRARCLESTGSGWAGEIESPFMPVVQGSGYDYESMAEATQFMDVNDDGIMDWCAEVDSELNCMLSTPDGFGESVVTYVLPDLGGISGLRNLREVNRGWADADGDGKVSYCALYWKDIYPRNRGMACFDSGSLENHDYLVGVTNGLGLSYEVEYKDIADPSVYSYNSGTGPHGEIYAASGVNVVSRLLVSNGVGGVNEETYYYEDYGYLEGEIGGLGFRYIETTSEDGKRINEAWYLHEPYLHQTGRLESSQTSYLTDSGALQVVSEQENTWETVLYSGSGFNVEGYDGTIWDADDATSLRYRVQQVESESTSHDLNGAFRQSVVSTNTYDNFGNLTGATVTTSGPQQTFTKTVTSQFDDFLDDWILGRITRSSVTQSGTYNGVPVPAITKTSEWEYYSPSQSQFGGMVKKEIIEPDQPELRKEKSYTYNAFGLKESVTTSVPGSPPRSVQFGYDPSGRFQTSVTNELGHQVTYTYDEVTGAKLTQQDPNGLVSSWEYDSVGRVVREQSPGGQATEVRLATCVSGCPAHATYYSETWTTSASGAVMSPKTREYKDKLGRTVQTRSQGLDGTYIYNVAQYDPQGRLLRSSQPYEAGDTVHWDEVLERDAMGRATKKLNASGALLETQFNGLTTTQTTSWTGQLGAGSQVRVSSVTEDVAGNMRQATDNDGRQITYFYDATGQLTKALLPGGVELVNQYDQLGRKVLSSDPNIGTWRYAYDGYDQLILQENGSGRRVCFSHDILGRKVARTDDYLASSSWEQAKSGALSACQGQLADANWSYDSPSKGVGRLSSIQTSEGYSQEPFYDSLGRVVRTETSYGQEDYVSTREYDPDTGKVALMTPTHRDQGPSISVEYRYNALGFLTELGKAGTSDYYWQILSQNARGDVTQRRFANGMIENQAAYDDATGMVSQIRSKMMLASGWDIQDETYVYDPNGTMLQRTQTNTAQNLDIEETFGYDNLDRLISASVDNLSSPGMSFDQTVQYDVAGNITSRNDVGTYSYQESCQYQGETFTPGPYAVTQVSGARNEQYCYDDGGNMLIGGNKTISYTSFNKPVSISTPDAQVDFVYGPSREILRKISSTSSKTISKTSIGSYEALTISESGSTTVKERWSLPGGVVVSLEDGDTSTLKDEYLFSDALGSIVAVANQLGGVTERFQYDPWGRPRHGLNWTLLTDTAWFELERDENTTGKGFTGHEMLDQVGVIHMGGRIYDPTLGRFMSADPVVKGLKNTESYNRYSYVLNNPMSYTDPTGYSWWSENITDKWRDFRKEYKREIMQCALGPVGEALFRYGGRALSEFAQRNKYAGEVIGIVSTVACGPAAPLCAAGANASIAYANDASLSDVAKIGVKSAALAYSNQWVAGRIGAARDHGTIGSVGAAGLHGARGAAFAAASGGGARSGFVGGVTESALGGAIQYLVPNDAGGTLTAALTSGTVSQVTGGKFAVGALQGAVGYRFNQIGDHQESSIFGFFREEGVNLLLRAGQALGGLGQVLLGGAICTGVVTCAGGGVLAVKGVDNIQAGIRGTDSLAQQGLVAVTGSQKAGTLINAGLDLGTSVTGLMRSVPKISAYGTPYNARWYKGSPGYFEPAVNQAAKPMLMMEGFSSGATIYGTIE